MRVMIGGQESPMMIKKGLRMLSDFFTSLHKSKQHAAS
jgi:hypothetical protein